MTHIADEKKKKIHGALSLVLSTWSSPHLRERFPDLEGLSHCGAVQQCIMMLDQNPIAVPRRTGGDSEPRSAD
jgi:hypothetical protein